MMMLLVGAPVLIDAKVSRNFLEEAQHLGGEMARTLTTMAKTPGKSAISGARLDSAAERLQAAPAPLLELLNPEERSAVSGAGSR